MGLLFDEECNYKNLNPLVLAFIGDAIYDLMARHKIILESNASVGKLNKIKVKMVCCKAQSEAFNNILDFLTEEELNIYKRGRNAHTRNIPKNSTSAQYHSATGLEALFGYLYLKNDISRLRELFSLISNIKDGVVSSENIKK